MPKDKTSGTKLTREQLINFLQRKEEESDTTPYVVKALQLLTLIERSP